MSLLALTSAFTIFCTVAGRLAMTSGRVSSVVPCTSPPMASSVPLVVNMSTRAYPFPCFMNTVKNGSTIMPAWTESFSMASGMVLPPAPMIFTSSAFTPFLASR